MGRFLAAGVRTDDRLLIIAAPAHTTGICAALGAELVEKLLSRGQLTLIDASELLAEFMRGDMPDPALFRNAVSRIIASSRAHAGVRLRAFGEMVDILWRQGRTRAAIRLEELWNEVGGEHDFSLLCAYTMGHFYREGDSEQFVEVCGRHSHVLPTESFARIESADSMLRQISVLEQRSRLLETEIHSRKEIEHALRDALEQRARGQADLTESLRREEEARKTAEQSDAFKEVFISVLGHDLRNPLNTILTTTRLMALRGELGRDSAKRLDRVIKSGVRLQRMVEQILDMTRDRLAGGISLSRGFHDLAPLVTKVAEGVQVAHPGHSLELRMQRSVVSVDAERFEQVATTLIDNAVAHGDPERPVTVSVAERAGTTTFSVHNYGPAIDRESLDLLFDPFRRARKPVGHSAGLGLGLYISARIALAHAGKLRVESSEGAGTLFELSIPRDD